MCLGKNILVKKGGLEVSINRFVVIGEACVQKLMLCLVGSNG